ncbi:MAG: ATP-binding protein [Candidatus Marinimicrobia bacterium]|nr:ATP-binding protein [Candidatus Neomarinimicrobiota bacterium]
MNKESIKGVLRQRMEQPWPAISRRDLQIPVDSGKVITLIGARRTGKTFLMFQTIGDLLAAGVDQTRIIYLNFEDDRLYPIQTAELDLILRAHAELFPDASREKRYLFFDELQNVPEWERYVRRIYDTENVAVFLTGSSSSLLGKDMSTAMRGRSISFEVFPLSFAEFLRFRQIEYTPYSADSEARVAHAFQAYLDWGGFPEVVTAEEALKPLILQEYAALMLHRDLIERHGVRNEHLMHLLLKFCAEHTASLVSINKLFNDFTSRRVKVGKATLYDYMSMLEDAYIALPCPKYDPSSRRQLQAPSKMHMLDPGLCRVFRPFPERDIGHRFETVIFLHERRQRRDLFHYRNGFEIDICWDEGRAFVNAAWDMNDPSTIQRERDAYEKGCRLWKGTTGRLVYGSAATLPDALAAHAAPGWKYLLAESWL